jgi:GT2 family glycosyltransferase
MTTAQAVGPATVWAIVLTHGGAEEITAACVDSLLLQDYRALTVLLVDNASYDGSGKRLRERYPQISYINTGGNFGYTGGNNRGMRHALDRGADFVMVLNNDTTLDPRCVSTLVESTKGTAKLGAVAPKILFYDDPSRIWFGGGDFSKTKALGTHRHELEPDNPDEPIGLQSSSFATGCCFLMPAAVARAMGGFAEDFFIYCEDAELSLRLTQAGYHLYYQPAARVYHREPPAPPDPTPFQIRMRDRNRRRIARRHFGSADRLAFAAWFYPTRLVRLGQYVVRRDWQRARAIVEGAVER